MRQPQETELAAADELLTALENYYDESDDTLEPIVPGHPIHAAVENWRRTLPRKSLAPEFSRLRARLWELSKQDRAQAKDAASDFGQLLIRCCPSLASHQDDESDVDAGRWFESPPPPDGAFQHGPISGQLQQLAGWMERDQRTLKKHNGRGSYYIARDHGRQFSVWFFSARKYQEVQQRQRAGNA